MLIYYTILIPGILNSAVCFNETGMAKKFTLKDGNHTLQCIFYETVSYYANKMN